MTKAGVQGSSCKIGNHPNFWKHVWCEGTFIIESKVSSGRWPVVEESPPCDGETNCSEACSCCRASLWWGWQNIMDKLWELHFMTLAVTNMTMALLMRNLSWVERKLNELVALASFVRVWTLQIREIMMIREGGRKNITTGEKSWAIASSHFLNNFHFFDYFHILTISILWLFSTPIIGCHNCDEFTIIEHDNFYQLVILVVMVRNLKLKMSIFPNLRNWIWPETLEKIYSLVTMLVISSIIANRII